MAIPKMTKMCQARKTTMTPAMAAISATQKGMLGAGIDRNR